MAVIAYTTSVYNVIPLTFPYRLREKNQLKGNPCTTIVCHNVMLLWFPPKKKKKQKKHIHFFCYSQEMYRNLQPKERRMKKKKVICRKQKQNFRDYFRGVSFDAPLLFASSIHTRNQIHRNCIFIGVYDADRNTLFIR